MALPSLAEVQESFLAAIQGQCHDDAAPFEQFSLPDLVVSARRLDGAARLDIYRQMYHDRLVDVLREDFASVVALVGDERFADLARDYLQCHPSTHPSVRHLGEHFASFLARDGDTDSASVLADLALLEWARLEVFDAPDARALRLEDLVAIPEEGWGDLALWAIPAFRLLDLGWPVHTLLGSGSEVADSPPREPHRTVVRVWRADYLVYTATVDPIEEFALRRLLLGDRFGEICASTVKQFPDVDATAEVAGLLLRWIEDGLVRDLSDTTVK